MKLACLVLDAIGVMFAAADDVQSQRIRPVSLDLCTSSEHA